MKQKRYKLFALLFSMTVVIMSCQSGDYSYNNIPQLTGNVDAKLNVDDVSNVILLYEGLYDPASCYFLISESSDMTNARKIPAGYNANNATCVELKDLKAATTYYFTFHNFLDHGDVGSQTGEFTTYRYPMTAVGVKVNKSNIRNAGFYIFDESDKLVSNNLMVESQDGELYMPGVKTMFEMTFYLYRPYQKGNYSYEKVPISNALGNFEYAKTTVTPPNPVPSCDMTSVAYNVVVNVTVKPRDEQISVKQITGLELTNRAGSTAISNNGTCNLSTGEVTPIPSEKDYLTTKMEPIPLNSTVETPVNFYSLIPAKFEEGEVLLNVQISDKNNLVVDTPIALPASEWKGGNSYVYNITVYYTRHSYEVVISDVYVQPWKNGGEEKIEIDD